MKTTTFAIWCISLMIALACKPENPQKSIHEIELKIDHSYYDLTPENVYRELMKHEVKFADIVLRQAILETGWFTSYNCLTRNNLFGMTGGKKTPDNVHGYMIYKDWTYSISGYKRWQRRHWSDIYPDYYTFLKSVGYAESPEYIDKLKKIKIIIIKK